MSVASRGPSWPDLIRLSASTYAQRALDSPGNRVDARVKPAHDDLWFVSAQGSRSPKGRGLALAVSPSV